MNLKKLLLTENDCYKSGKKHTVKGIMVHSTGANNPNLKRYVGPDDGLLGMNQYGNHWNTPKPGGRKVCVHAFIGKLADGSIATYQTLPWDIVGWHSGSGRLGSAKNANNNGYIGFEICEDGLSDSVYFGKVYQEAVELCAYLCKQYNLDPTADGVIIGHYEGHARGIASNHGDPKNWFPKHGKSMDTFRAAVKALVSTPAPAPTPKPTGEIKVGDIVEFTGNTHYTSASAKSGVKCKPGKAKVTALYPKGTHPYPLIRESGGGSTVYGWVDASTVSKVVVTPPSAPAAPQPYTVKVTADALNIRRGPGTQHAITGVIKDKGTYTIVDTQGTWGKLKSGAGWISLNFTDVAVRPIVLNDVVNFLGGRYYVSSGGGRNYVGKAGRARVTQIVKGAKYPYHVIRVDSTSTVYGWVAEASVKK